MPQKFDIVCVGDVKIDTFLFLQKTNPHIRSVLETNEFCLKLGEKITVDKLQHFLGGDAANVAVGLTRLGLKSSLVAELGTDEFVQKIINSLKKENVDTSNLSETKGQESSFSIILSFGQERTIFSEHVVRNHDFNFDNIQTQWIYLTSLGEKWKNAYGKILTYLKKTNCHLAFNPGTLQINGAFKDIEKQMSRTDILFLNKEESMTILNIKNETLNIQELLTGLKKLGPKVVVITDGANGSYAIDENGNFFKQDIVPTQVVEKTGAGDAYSSGFLSAILKNKSIKEAMELGAKNSAATLGQVGAQNGLLYEE